jgi:hypothetical protein
MAEQKPLMSWQLGSKKQEKGRKELGIKHTLQRRALRDLCSPAGPHFLIAHSAKNSSMDSSTDEVRAKVIQSPSCCTTTGDQAFNICTFLRDTAHPNHHITHGD